MLDTIDITTLVGLRDRALIGLMVYTFARAGAVIGMRVADVYVQGRRTWVRLNVKGGKVLEMPCHHNLDEYVHAYLSIDGGGDDKKAFSIPDAKGRGGHLSALLMSQADVYQMVGWRAAAASVDTKIGLHSFLATGISEYLRNGGKLEFAQQMATMRARERQGSTTDGRIRYRSISLSGSESKK